MRYLFVALVELRPEQGCELLDPAKVNGARVRCYVPAADEPSAYQRFSDYFAAQRLCLVATEWLVRDDEVDWDNPDDPTARHLTKEAVETGEVVVGELHSWGHDAPDAQN